jgi:hypothetical protein
MSRLSRQQSQKMSARSLGASRSTNADILFARMFSRVSSRPRNPYRCVATANGLATSAPASGAGKRQAAANA